VEAKYDFCQTFKLIKEKNHHKKNKNNFFEEVTR